MCPDVQLISLYHDQELPSPWKEKLEAHLETCAQCQAKLDSYRRLGAFLQSEGDEGLTAAQERVWKDFTAPRLVIDQPRAPGSFWKRNLSVPLPAAAALAVLIFSLVFFVLRPGERQSFENPQAFTAFDMGLDDHGVFPIQDMSGVLQFLSSQEHGDFMIIPLPESRSFSRTGTPTLINAADYSRSSPSR
ncbi:MAG: zf-HC2 domain-containing protein [Treponema sp.]|nr:zf-HC2 domain-containing protein [Treponema sp.]